jgi:hypothetical protein
MSRWRTLRSLDDVFTENADHRVEVVQPKAFVGRVDEIVDQSNARTSLSVFDDLGRHEEGQPIEPLNVRFETERQLLIVNDTRRTVWMSPRFFRRQFHDEILNQFFCTHRFQSILTPNTMNISLLSSLFSLLFSYQFDVRQLLGKEDRRGTFVHDVRLNDEIVFRIERDF